MTSTDKPLRWMRGTLRTPPVGRAARIEAGVRLRRLQRGESLAMPESRPMPSIGRRVHELRIDDPETRKTWRIVYRVDPEAILVVHWFAKKTQMTTRRVIELCKRRLGDYDRG
jgi:phage-related protein